MPAHATPRRRAAERGLVLVPVLLVAMLLGALAMGLVEEGLGERTAVKHQVSNLIALELCEIGLVKSELEIVTNKDRDGNGIGNVEGEANGGTYRVEATRVAGKLRRWMLLSRGEHGLSVRRVEVGLKIKGGLFPHALFGKDSVQVEGNSYTDSYDSRLGTWAAQAVNGSGKTDDTWARTNGSVGSNLDVSLGNPGIIRGAVQPGPTGVFSGDPDDVWSGVSPLAEPVDLPPPDLEDFLGALAKNENHRIDATADGIDYDPVLYQMRLASKGVLTLDGGTYFFTEFTAAGGGTLNVTRPTTIYVTGTVDLGGGTINNMSGVPGDLVIMAHPYDIVPGYDPTAAKDVELNGGVLAAYSVYAPGKRVDVGGGNHVFGAVVGETVRLIGNSQFHYDEALADWGYGEKKLGTRLYWVELGSHNH